MFRFAQGAPGHRPGRLGRSDLRAVSQNARIRTRRYGPPQIIGNNVRGEPLWASPGKSPLAEQRRFAFHGLLALAKQVEIEDEALVLGRTRVSA